MPDLTIESIIEAHEAEDAPTLTADEKTFLTENKADLTDEQLEKFGLNEEEDEDEITFEDDGEEPIKKKSKKGGEEDDDDDTAAMTPEDKKAIEKTAARIANEMIAPIRAQADSSRVDIEWAQALSKYPELKAYESKVLRFAKNETRSGQPVMSTIIEVAGVDVFAKIGAIRQKKADREAQATRGGSTTVTRRSEPVADHKKILNTKVPSFAGKSLAEIAKIRADISAGKYRN